MRFRFMSGRSAAFTGIILALQLAPPKSARADGEDVPFLTSILAESVTTVSNLVNMLQVLQQQLAATKQLLSKLDPSSYDALRSTLHSNELSFGQLSQGVNSIGHTLASVNSQFRTVYKRDYSDVPLADFDSNYARWHDEILSAAEIAARSHTTLATLERNTDAAAAILRNSASAEGVVAQLQATNQMLGVIQSQNNALLQSLATTGRVLSSAAGSQAADAQLSREKKKRSLENYRDRGDDVPPMTKLP